jgi:hypothetical protein
MIEVKQAVETAANYLADLFAEEGISDIRLEEVELSDDSQTWYITFSFLRKAKQTGRQAMDDLQYALGQHHDRDYKVLALRADDGVVTSVKIRQLA